MRETKPALNQMARMGRSTTLSRWGGVVFEVQNPFAMLYRCSQTHGLKPLVQSVLEGLSAAPDRPLNIVLYGDEITPGNALAHKHRRKSWGIYWTLLEFGPAALSCEDRVW